MTFGDRVQFGCDRELVKGNGVRGFSKRFVTGLRSSSCDLCGRAIQRTVGEVVPWRIKLQGDEDVLFALIGQIQHPPVVIYGVRQDVYLTSWQLDHCGTEQEVRARAAPWISSLSGIAAIDLDPTEPIANGGAEQIQERQRIPRRDSRAERYMRIAEGNEHAARVLSLIGAAPSWEELRMIMRIIDADLAPRSVVTEGWTTPYHHSRLRAAFATFIDDEPQNQGVMTLRAAESHVRRIAGTWLHCRA
jgi:hypothetical protein